MGLVYTLFLRDGSRSRGKGWGIGLGLGKNKKNREEWGGICGTQVTEFRPIDLCNVLHKIISKTVANRLKKGLPHVISEFHSVLIPDRMILDNVLAAFETIHYLKRLGKAGRGKLMLKLDIAKAYDRVEWTFLNHMTHSMEFPARFVNFIMGHITTASYLVLLRGRPFEPTQVDKLKRIYRTMRMLSGQQINLEKSAMC
ncbi:hypothetical protein L3X38_009964 [Prunus dulcis]|uniref:Reverse transcriptase domain-containing protein n=1 Tax=Prunus dulcis TaxID=3755 RepID=A0AAD4WEV4_PRUDU|nr:hypothetical protein L3X38_009964 [Prunus dulcis]